MKDQIANINIEIRRNDDWVSVTDTANNQSVGTFRNPEKIIDFVLVQKLITKYIATTNFFLNDKLTLD